MKGYCISIVSVLCIFTTSTLLAAPADVLETGQTNTVVSGDDGSLQRGYELPSPRFVAIGDGTVTDNLTGLIWLQDATCLSSLNWQTAFDAVGSLPAGPCVDDNSAGDWRLPNILELYSLFHYQYVNPGMSNVAGDAKWLPGDAFTGLNEVKEFWSSTPYMDGQGTQALSADFLTMIISREGKSATHGVLAVREGPSYPAVYHNLRISMPGSGSGTVTGVFNGTSDDAGINCVDDCTIPFVADSALTLTATPDENSHFGGWRGGCSSDGRVTLDAARSCEAIFRSNSGILFMVVPVIAGGR